MEYSIFDLKYDKSSEITTEIMFNVASARAAGAKLIRFNISFNEDPAVTEKRIKHTFKTLRNMKKAGKLECFVTKEDLKGSSTEAAYMYNRFGKHIDVSDEACEEVIYISL